MFRPNWPSSGVHVVMVKVSAAHCNAGFFPPIVVASRYFGLVWFVGCGCLQCSCWGGSSVVCWSPITLQSVNLGPKREDMIGRWSKALVLKLHQSNKVKDDEIGNACSEYKKGVLINFGM
jgi:hypothetical protein